MINAPASRLLLFSTLAALFSACAAPNQPAGLTEPAYFNLDEILDKQIKMLAEKSASVQKTSLGQSQPESKTITGVNWQRELDLFRQAAINRPAWRHDFEADTLKAPEGGSLIRYLRKPESKASVKKLEITLSASGELQKVQALVATENMLFSTSKILEMQLGNNGAPVLKQYLIKGSEKMIFTDSRLYELRANVVL